MNRIVAVILCLALFSVVSQAQVLYAYDLATTGVGFETYLPTAAYPTGESMPGPVPLPANGLLAFPPTGAGGAAADLRGVIYTSDGFQIAIDPNAAVYGPFSFLPPSSGPFPVTFPGGFGFITGLTVDTSTNTLWATDGAALVPYNLFPPFIPTGPTVPLLIPPMFFTGLGFASDTGNFWLTTFGGTVYEFSPAGAVVSGPYVNVTFGPVGGLAVNTTNAPGAFPPPACSTQVAGYHICIGDGSAIYDAVTPAPPLPSPLTTPNGIAGLAFSPDVQITAGATGCLTSGSFPIPGTLAPVVANGAPNGLAVAGAPPISIVDGWLDLCPIPGGAFLFATGETLWVNPFSSTAASFGVTTDATGFGALPFSIPPSVVFSGIQFTWQWFVPDALHPILNCLSDAATLTAGY